MKAKILSMVVLFSVLLWVAGVECSTNVSEVRPLNFRVLDAENSKTLGKLIMVSTTPTNAVHIYDPRSETNTSIPLSLAPTCVSVSPDGLYATVGHNAWISYVNLTSATVEKTIAVTCDVLDIILAGNGYAYAFPRRDQWEKIRCINIATGAETLSTGSSIHAGTLARLHPNGTAMYGADNGLSPSDIEKYDITNGTAQYLYDSPYHGDFSMCGDLWISEDGLRIFTRCGNVFRSSDVGAEDMMYNGLLSELTTIESLSHSSESNKVVVIPEAGRFTDGTEDTEIQIYDYSFLTFDNSIELPDFQVGDNAYLSHGRFVYHNGPGSEFYVVVQADDTSGLLYDFGIVTFISRYSPVADAGEDKIVLDQVVLDGSNSLDPDGSIESYEWTLRHMENPQYDRTAEGVNPVVMNLEPGFYNVTLTVSDDEGLTGADTMLLAVAGACEGPLPYPDSDLNLKKFKLKTNKKSGITRTSIKAEITNLPALNANNDGTFESRITIELFGALDEGDLVLSDTIQLDFNELKRSLSLQK